MDAVAPHVPHLTWSDPIPAPDLRWQIACHLHERAHFRRGRRRRRRSDPDWLDALLALNEVLHPSGRRRSRFSVSPELMSAHLLYQSETPSRWEVEARILAGQSNEDVALSTGFPPAVVGAFERFFFNVRDRLAAGDYILFGVVGYDPLRGFKESDLPSKGSQSERAPLRSPDGRHGGLADLAGDRDPGGGLVRSTADDENLLSADRRPRGFLTVSTRTSGMLI